MKYYKENIEDDFITGGKVYINEGQCDKSHYPLHYHENLEFDLVIKGKIKGRVNKKMIEVNEGNFLFVNSGELHETYAENIWYDSS